MDSRETENNTGLRLLKRSKTGLIRVIFSRTGLALLCLLGQALVLLAGFLWFERHTFSIISGHRLIAVFMAIYLINTPMDPTAKLTWLLIIFPLPIFGALLYLFTRSEWGHRTMKARLTQIQRENRHALRQDSQVLEALKIADPGAAAMVNYVSRSGCYPVYSGCDVTYFPLGEDKFKVLLEELEKAEKFIYLEYFIVGEGLMWGKILEILARKAKQGVDVRMMYDGSCEFSLLPRSYPRQLEKLGIRCKVFSPVHPFVSTHYNYRDHRKILVIDGHTAFNGGINLADEYINHVSRFGHWKDTAVMVRGEAAESFTLMFLELWNLTGRSQNPMPPMPKHIPSGQGFVMPYADDPLDGEKVGKQVYIDLLNRARRYAHIMTPYLILDAELEGALIYAARRGVEVTLLLPGIPDKKTPYAIAKTYYRRLLNAGVRIYEYTPGFVHAKVFVVDDREAVVGTINLDYRSLYHHFECATYLHSVACIPEIEADFQETIAKGRLVTRETIRTEKITVRLTGWIMKLVAPLM
jgi:cardiolipin synthase